jgi:hypothetical protein
VLGIGLPLTAVPLLGQVLGLPLTAVPLLGQVLDLPAAVALMTIPMFTSKG